jgi:hypothetical protein
LGVGLANLSPTTSPLHFERCLSDIYFGECDDRHRIEEFLVFSITPKIGNGQKLEITRVAVDAVVAVAPTIGAGGALPAPVSRYG